MAATGDLRAECRLADFARRRSIRGVRGAGIQARIRFLHESLPPGARVARLDVAGLEPVPGIRAREHRDVHLRTVVHRRDENSSRLGDSEQVDDGADTGAERAGRLPRWRIEPVTLRGIEAPT